MTLPRCCNTQRANAATARSTMNGAARKAVHLGERWPKYIDAANQAKAAYIRARDERATHAATCDAGRVDA